MSQRNDDNRQIINKRLGYTYNNLIDLVGIIVILIIGKEYFKRNSEVGDFIEKVFDETFPEYVIRSRTLMAARTCRLVINCNEEEVEKLILKINKYLEKIQTEKEQNNTLSTKKNRKKNENTKFEKWLKGF